MAAQKLQTRWQMVMDERLLLRFQVAKDFCQRWQLFLDDMRWKNVEWFFMDDTRYEENIETSEIYICEFLQSH